LADGNIDLKALVGDLVADIGRGTPPAQVGARFHNTLVETVRQKSRRMGMARLAFSGGVFQNELLVDLLIDRLGATHTLNFHRQLSPNDECIAFGQLAWFYTQKRGAVC
jgi:hydrogenase maturation protein HypF